MSLAENMEFASGYSVEPYELINILENFGGIVKGSSGVHKDNVEIFQIETRNPHFHEDKGDDHVTSMLQESLSAINNSKICNTDITRDIKNHLLVLQQKTNQINSRINGSTNNHIMDTIKIIPIDKFNELVIDSPKLLHLFNTSEI